MPLSRSGVPEHGGAHRAPAGAGALLVTPAHRRHEAGDPPSFGLYLHVPFCSARCIYCDFNTYIDLHHLTERYVRALVREIRLVGEMLDHRAAHTIFFGGGTPSLLKPAHVAAILDACAAAFALSSDVEITLEANPESTTRELLRALRHAGVNRLSLGVQSFDDGLLRFLGRLHTAHRAQEAVEWARAAGFDNINLDLMYGLPGQSEEMWRRSLDEALRLAPEHLSLYALTVEPGTPLHRHVTGGHVELPADETAAAQYEWARERLEAAGYAHYEISNWARHQGEALTPSLASRHNLLYWRNQEYAGLGAGAHSYVNSMRYANLKRPEHYIAAVERGEIADDVPAPALDPRTLDPIDPDLAMREHMILGLRLVREGVAFADFERRHGVGLEARFGRVIARLVADGWLEHLPDRVRLTRRSHLVANRVFVEFL